MTNARMPSATPPSPPRRPDDVPAVAAEHDVDAVAAQIGPLVEAVLRALAAARARRARRGRRLAQGRARRGARAGRAPRHAACRSGAARPATRIVEPRCARRGRDDDLRVLGRAEEAASAGCGRSRRVACCPSTSRRGEPRARATGNRCPGNTDRGQERRADRDTGDPCPVHASHVGRGDADSTPRRRAAAREQGRASAPVTARPAPELVELGGADAGDRVELVDGVEGAVLRRGSRRSSAPSPGRCRAAHRAARPSRCSG